MLVASNLRDHNDLHTTHSCLNIYTISRNKPEFCPFCISDGVSKFMKISMNLRPNHFPAVTEDLELEPLIRLYRTQSLMERLCPEITPRLYP